MTPTRADAALDAFAELVGGDAADLVAVEGGRTRWSSGGPPAEGVRIVPAPAGVVDHQPEEMIVRVRAGTTVAELEAVLAAAGQRSALPTRGGTVGGAVAVGEDHPEVLGRGRLRASVLQVTYVSAEGRLVSGGGPTVKNVSGFDLPRLMTGALGTLGLLAEVILRTNPIPPASRWLRSADADPFAVPATVLRPAAVLWDGAATWVRLEGHGADVEDEGRRLRALGAWQEASGPPSLPTHRWSMRPSALRHIDPVATGPFVASVGVGTVFATNAAPPAIEPDERRRLAARVKAEFDPTGRLNRGRDPMRRSS